MEDDLTKYESAFGMISPADISYEVTKTAKIYPRLVKLFIPKTPYRKNIPFLEPHIDEFDGEVEDWATQVNTSQSIDEDNIERSMRRSKTLLTDYTLCNEFDIFATFTFSPEKSDRQNPELVKMQMANWLRNQRNRFGRFKYLMVPEFHKDRKALHFHGLFKDYKGALKDTGKLHNGRPVKHFKSYTLGHNTAVPIDNIEKVSSYIKKYIVKDMPQFRDKRRFWSTLNLERPRVIDNPSPEVAAGFGTPVKVYENEYGSIIYFERKGGEEDKAS